MYQESTFRARSEALVISLVGLDTAYRWWNSQNKAFNNLTPEQQWKIDYEVVYEYLMANANCEYS